MTEGEQVLGLRLLALGFSLPDCESSRGILHQELPSLGGTGAACPQSVGFATACDPGSRLKMAQDEYLQRAFTEGNQRFV
jgi:hypothetical protein